MSMLKRSNQLSVSITDVSGAVHRYVFSLQPNDLALQHCDWLGSGTRLFQMNRSP